MAEVVLAELAPTNKASARDRPRHGHPGDGPARVVFKRGRVDGVVRADHENDRGVI